MRITNHKLAMTLPPYQTSNHLTTVQQDVVRILNASDLIGILVPNIVGCQRLDGKLSLLLLIITDGLVKKVRCMFSQRVRSKWTFGASVFEDATRDRRDFHLTTFCVD